MEILACPACGSSNPSDALLCSFCNSHLRPVAYIPPDKSAPHKFDWFDGRTKAIAIGIVFVLAFIFAPGGIYIPFKPDTLQFRVFFLFQFPLGLIGAVEWILYRLTRYDGLSGATYLTLNQIGIPIGWLIYLISVITIMWSSNRKQVRNLFIALVILVVINIAGCYQTVSGIHWTG